MGPAFALSSRSSSWNLLSLRSILAIFISFSRGILFGGSRASPWGFRGVIRAIRFICHIFSLLFLGMSRQLLSFLEVIVGSFKKFQCSRCLGGYWWYLLSINISLPIFCQCCLCLHFNLFSIVSFVLESPRMIVASIRISYISRYTAFISNQSLVFSSRVPLAWVYASPSTLTAHPFAF